MVSLAKIVHFLEQCNNTSKHNNGNNNTRIINMPLINYIVYIIEHY